MIPEAARNAIKRQQILWQGEESRKSACRRLKKRHWPDSYTLRVDLATPLPASWKTSPSRSASPSRASL
jgi:hypothetical protein